MTSQISLPVPVPPPPAPGTGRHHTRAGVSQPGAQELIPAGGGETATGMSPTLTITVHGKAAPQGSKHGRPIYKGRGDQKVFTGKVAQVESSKESHKTWREAVKSAALDAREEWRIGWLNDHWKRLEDCPIRIEITFSFDKPASAPKRRRTWPIKRSTFDVDKLQRSTFDALVDAGIFKDDSQIIDVHARKAYVDDPVSPLPEPGAVIRVWEVTAQ